METLWIRKQKCILQAGPEALSIWGALVPPVFWNISSWSEFVSWWTCVSRNGSVIGPIQSSYLNTPDSVILRSGPKLTECTRYSWNKWYQHSYYNHLQGIFSAGAKFRKKKIHYNTDVDGVLCKDIFFFKLYLLDNTSNPSGFISLL